MTIFSTPARRLLATALIAASALLAAGFPPLASAAAPAKQGTQVPGFYRMALGEVEVTALYDGYVALDPKLLKGASAKDIQSLLARMFVDTSHGMQTAVNAYLLNTGANLILIDTGAAKCFGPTLGGIGDNIRAAGYRTDQIDTVLLTHLHGDHACGLVTAEGKPAFPKATVYAAQEEAAYWLDKEAATKAPKEAQSSFKTAQDAVAPYVAAGKFKQFKAGDTIVPGVVAVAEPGHTPGHSGYLVSSGNQQMLVWGDLVHSHAVQFAHPEVAIEFDTDSKQAVATRNQIFADAAKKKLWVAGAHLPFPGIGHVRQDRNGYAWVPVEFAPLPPAKSGK